MKMLTLLGPWGDGELHSAASACTDTRPRGLSACRPPTPALACSWWKPASFRWPLCGGSPPTVPSRQFHPPGTHHPAGVLTTGKGTRPFPFIPKHCVSLGCLPGMRPRGFKTSCWDNPTRILGNSGKNLRKLRLVVTGEKWRNW